MTDTNVRLGHGTHARPWSHVMHTTLRERCFSFPDHRPSRRRELTLQLTSTTTLGPGARFGTLLRLPMFSLSLWTS